MVFLVISAVFSGGDFFDLRFAKVFQLGAGDSGVSSIGTKEGGDVVVGVSYPRPAFACNILAKGSMLKEVWGHPTY